MQGNKFNLGKVRSDEVKLKIHKAKDTTIYHFIHPEFGDEYLTQYDLCSKYKLRRAGISVVVTNNRVRHKQWEIKR